MRLYFVDSYHTNALCVRKGVKSIAENKYLISRVVPRALGALQKVCTNRLNFRLF